MLRLCKLSIAALVIWAASAAHADEPKVVTDAKEAAEWIATALSSSGYKADFTLESFKEIDRFVDDQTQNGRPRPGGLLAENFGARVFALGAYVGGSFAGLVRDSGMATTATAMPRSISKSGLNRPALFGLCSESSNASRTAAKTAFTPTATSS
jgi:hypothetical protein